MGDAPSGPGRFAPMATRIIRNGSRGAVHISIGN
jgi:hypothetical protein